MTTSNRLAAETPFCRKFSLGYYVNGGAFGPSYFSVNPSHKETVIQQLKDFLKLRFSNPSTIVCYKTCVWDSVESRENFYFDVVSVGCSFVVNCQVFSI